MIWNSEWRAAADCVCRSAKNAADRENENILQAYNGFDRFAIST
jgi:hypothetical protein